ncbi:MAG TPA: hypothetical protein VH165_35480, partial [Kofleriaceae bacterium]|nr:hypothetical protein [Kofleriaceae bacterium]
ARHAWLVAIAVAYFYVVPYFPRIHSANELPRAYLVQAIAADHTFAIDRGVARWGATADVSPSGGHQYSNKAPGSSLLAVPAYAAVRAVAGEPSLGATLWICRVFAGILPMLAFLGLLWSFLARFAPDPDVRRLVLVGYALGSLAMTYSILFYSHQLGAICIASAWILALDVAGGRRGLRTMLVAGALAGAAPLMDYQAAFAALPVAVHVLIELPRGQRLRAVAVAAAGAAPPIAVLLAYHAICFGSPLRTGYDASTTFAMYHQQGFLGITALRGEAFWGSLIRPDNGLVTLSPWWLLAIPGGAVLWRRGERGVAATAAAVTAIYVLFISSINFWRGGWEVGPRYIAAMLPFLLPPVAALLQRWADAAAHRRLGVAAGLVGVGLVVYVLSAATFPYWPDTVRHPLYDITFRLLADRLVAPNLGSALGVAGLAGLVPYLVVTFGVLGAIVWRLARGPGLVIAAAVTALIVVTYGQLPHGDARADNAYRSVRSAVVDL